MKDLINSSIQSHSEALNLLDEKKIHHASKIDRPQNYRYSSP